MNPPAVVALPISCINADPHTDSLSYTAYDCVVSATELGDTPIPIASANPRDPSQTGIYREIRGTVENEPEKLRQRNNGVTLVVSRVEVIERDGQAYVVLWFGENEGVVNGGHTTLAVSDAVRDGAVAEIASLRIEIIVSEEFQSEELIMTATARNEGNSHEPRSLIHHQGYFEPLKQHIADSQFIDWYEGDSDHVEGALGSQELIRLLYALDPINRSSVYSTVDSDHRASASGSTSPLSQFERAANRWNGPQNADDPSEVDNVVISDTPRPWAHIYPIVPFINPLRDGLGLILTRTPGNNPQHVRLADHSVRGLQFWQEQIKQSGSVPVRQTYHPRWDGEEVVELSRVIEMTVLGWLRKNIWLSSGEASGLMGWRRDPLALLDATKVDWLSDISDEKDWSTNTINSLASDERWYSPDKQLPSEIRPRDPDIVRRYGDSPDICYVRTDSFDWAANYPGRSCTKDVKHLVPQLAHDDLEPTHTLTEDGELNRGTDEEQSGSNYARVLWFGDRGHFK